MTVFENLEVVARWGRPVKEWGRSQRYASEEPRHERVYEGEWTLSSTPRDPTPREAYAILSEVVRKWQVEHPEDELKYLEITRGSPQRLRAQFIHHGHSPAALLVILAAIATVVIVISKIVVPILYIALVIIAIWGVYRTVDYFVPEKQVYYCPKCELEFPTYESLYSHYVNVHPDQEPPPQPGPGIIDILKWGTAIMAGLVIVKWGVLPLLRKRKERASLTW